MKSDCRETVQPSADADVEVEFCTCLKLSLDIMREIQGRGGNHVGRVLSISSIDLVSLGDCT